MKARNKGTRNMFFWRKRKHGAAESNMDAVGHALKNAAAKEHRAQTGAFRAALICDRGRERGNNEDNYLLGMQINSEMLDHSTAVFRSAADGAAWQTAGVFDGMGGGEMGELAALIAAKTVKQLSGRLDDGCEKTDVDRIMREAFLRSNNEIIDLQKEHCVYGSTGTVVSIGSGEFKIYHLGDSRAYLLRDGELVQLTRDQTLAQMKMDAGLYRENDPGLEVERHKLTEYIGRDWTKENLRPQESAWIPIREDDRLLLCTDGLYDMCSDAEISGILAAAGGPENAVAALTQAALTKGGKDNITCMVIGFPR